MSTHLRPARPAALLWAALCLLLALTVRLHDLGRQSLWYDEAVTAQVAQQSLPELTRWTADDIQPPLYYAVAAGWTRLVGDSEWMLRFPSALFGGLMTVLAWALARRLWGRAAGNLAALLAALHPLWLYYSQEARMYTLLAALGMAAGYALLRLLDAPTAQARRRWWLLWLLAALGALYTHYFAVFLLGALALFFLFSMGRSPARRTLSAEGGVTAVLAVLGFAPWLPTLLRRFGEDASYWQGALKLDEALRHVAISFAVGETMLEQAALPWVRLNAVLAVLAVATLLWAASRGKQPVDRRGLWFSLVYSVLPVAAILLLAARTPKFNQRYLMLASPGLILLLAGGAAVALRRFSGRVFAQGAVVAGLAALLAGYALADRNWFADPAFTKDDWRGAVQFVAAQLADDEAPVLVSGHAYPAWRYYAPEHPVIRLPDSETLDVNAVLDLRVATQLDAALAGKQGGWLLQWQNEVVDPTGVVPFLLAGAGEELPVERTFWGLGAPRHFRWAGRPDFNAAITAMQPAVANFAGQVRLSGWTQPDCPLTPKERTCRVYLLWRAMAPLSADLKLAATLLDAEGHEWGRADQRLAAYDYPTFRWPVDAPQLGALVLTPDAGTPPGRYRLRLGVYAAADGTALDLLDAAGNPAGQALRLEPFTISRLIMPDVPASPALFQPAAGGESHPVSLQEVSLTPAQAEAGQPLLVQTWWWPDQSGLPDAVAAWQWIDSAGMMQTEGVLEPAAGYPSTQWQRGGPPFRSRWTLRVPAAAQPGEVWRLRIELVTRAAPHTALSNPLEAALTVQPSQRLFNAPPAALPLDHDFAGQITLLGIDLPPPPFMPGSSLPITVTWQAAAAPEANYTGFVHLLADGRVAAQDDHPPQRATSTWLPGEVALERYTIALPADLPPGAYRLEIGLYDAAAPGAPRPAPPAVVEVMLGH